MRLDLDLEVSLEVSKLHGIGDQFPKEPPDPFCASGNDGQRANMNTRVDRRARVLERWEQSFQYRGYVDGLVVNDRSSNHRVVEDVLDHELHALCAVDREVHVDARLIVELIPVPRLQQAGKRTHRTQGFLQVIGGDVRKLPQLGVRGLEIFLAIDQIRDRLLERLESQFGFLGESPLFAQRHGELHQLYAAKRFMENQELRWSSQRL